MRKFVLLFLAALTTGSLLAQNRQVSGIVTNPEGAPVSGATVIVRETSIGTVTDGAGRYNLMAPSDGILEVSMLGMLPAEEAINGRSIVDFSLKYSSTHLDDVIVVAFGTAKKEAFTGSASVLDAGELSKRTATNVVNSLAGQLPGVQIRNSDGQPGTEATMRIRGFTSLNAGNTPLIILDGSPFSGNLSSLNPADIESLTVLKDASATALYGARAANGVVMVTTKRAKRQEATISFEAKLGVGTRAAIDYDYIDDPATHYELFYSGLYNYAIAAGRDDTFASDFALRNMFQSANGSGLLRYNVYDTGTEPLIINGKLNPNAKLGRVVTNAGEEYYITPDDWQDAAFKKSLRQEYSLSINGGSEKASYYISLGYLNDKGIIAKSGYDRFTTRFKGDYQVKKWLKVGGNISYANTSSTVASGYDQLGGLNSANIFAFTSRIAPIFPLYLRDANQQIMHDELGHTMYDYGLSNVLGFSRPFLSSGNPIGAVQLDDDSSTANMFNMTGFAEITFVEGLKLNVTGTNYLNESRTSQFTNPYYGQYASSQGVITKAHRRYQGINLVQTLSYGRNIGDHNFDVMVGHENYNYKTTMLSGTKDHMFGVDVHELNAAVNLVSTASTATNYNTEGYFARAQYDYDNRYFGSVSYRRDATSRFDPAHRWGNFWSIGGAWLINNEKFMDSVDWVDMLKLKASYGTTGNDQIGDFRYVDTYEIVASNDGASVIPRTRGNKDITWETNASFNVGLEFELFTGRLSGSVEYYNRTTYDLLFSRPTPETSGFSSYYVNVGDMRNSGFEINLTGVAVRTRNLNLSFYANLTRNVNKILRLPQERINPTQNGFPSGSYFITEGGSIYDWYMPEFAGVNPDNGASMWYTSKVDAHKKPVGERGTTEDYSNEAIYYRQGSAMPDFYGGFGTSFYFYGFDLSVNFDYQVGGLAYDSAYADGMRSITNADGEAFHKDQLKAWSLDNKSSNIPRFQYGDAYNSARSSRFLTDASYLNLQNINLGYTIPARLSNKIKLQSIRIYCSAENIYYWSKRKGLDPRQNWDGSTINYNYSPIRTISGGLQVTF